MRNRVCGAIGRTSARVRAARTGLAGLAMGAVLVLALGPACAQAAEATSEGADASSATSVEATASESESSAGTESAAEGASSAASATGTESTDSAGGDGESGDAASSGASASTDTSAPADESSAAGDASDTSASIELSAPVIQRVEAQSKALFWSGAALRMRMATTSTGGPPTRTRSGSRA